MKPFRFIIGEWSCVLVLLCAVAGCGEPAGKGAAPQTTAKAVPPAEAAPAEPVEATPAPAIEATPLPPANKGKVTPLHEAYVRNKTSAGLGGNAKVKPGFTSESITGRLQGGRKYRFHWKLVGQRSGKDLYEITYQIGEDAQQRVEVEYDGTPLVVLDDPDLKIDINAQPRLNASDP